MNNTEIAVGLDIGTTKITVIIGRKNEHNKIEILGMGKAPSTGVMRGIVANIDKTTQSIKKALEEAVISSGLQISNVNVGIAGQHIKSLQHRGQLVRENLEVEINDNDIDANIILTMSKSHKDIILSQYGTDALPNVFTLSEFVGEMILEEL